MSHSLRKGYVSDVYAIKVPLTNIRYAGGWSTNSTVIESKYIDFTMRHTYAALLFFGYLKKDTPPREPTCRLHPRNNHAGPDLEFSAIAQAPATNMALASSADP